MSDKPHENDGFSLNVPQAFIEEMFRERIFGNNNNNNNNNNNLQSQILEAMKNERNHNKASKKNS